MSSQVSALRLFDLMQSHRVTAVIYVAARLWARRAVELRSADACQARKGNRGG